ncbi:hypothetical protein TWF569_009673 [Orbilia oligospora]|uniref:Uncharacterized protein n=1 Tax=Orbilia oligospora TaxID=2813651 RepID=A0A7C8JEB7_ORBOL|nr:hypothetical protein TWF706_001043 [Orbilia oligospora]KAF3096428.1 hypothetical protein TWF102_006699 [Orbilia oligospora]KAF3101455.1 hypothetical protein TWF103_008018 [Orbilia oligospora]KAF3133159.1 hypothetical protein TWF703_007001 [Orbilia oligospora]KAF3135741.1 hypothetical protein TWF569_009673 [Orbilia oligospora]
MSELDKDPGYNSKNDTGTDVDSPPKSEMLFGEFARFLAIYFIIQLFLNVTGIQQRFDNFAIRKGVEFREWIRERRERRDRERQGLEGGLGLNGPGEGLDDNAVAIDSEQNSYGARKIEVMGDTASIMELEHQAKGKLDYGTEPNTLAPSS